MSDAITRYELACRLLPNKWRYPAAQVPDYLKERTEEFRLRVGQPMTLLLPEGERLLTTETTHLVTPQELEQLCDSVCGYSRYAVSQTVAQGYLMADGGFRIGLCGTAVLTDGLCTNLREFSSAAVRIGRETRGIADEILPKLFDGERFCPTLLVSPPGGGKTTLLRELVRLLSDGSEIHAAMRVALADERGEVAGMYRGQPRFSIGSHTDVLDNCPKALAMELLTRTMNPQIIAVDEITAPQDIRAMEAAAYGGAALLATIHGADMTELRQKPLFRRLMKMQIFKRAVMISRDEGRRVYRVENLPCTLKQ